MKKMISLILAALMMVAIVPTAMAAGTAEGLTGTNMLGIDYTYAANSYNTTNNVTTSSDFTEMPAITAVGEGVVSGDKLYGENVDSPSKYEDGASIAEKLSDGYYFTYGEKMWSESKGVIIDGVTTPINANAPADSTANMVKFTEVNSGIDFTWTTAQKIARLNLWAWPADAIDGYEIQFKEKTDGKWYTIKKGSLDYNVSSAPSATNSTFYQIILDETVSAVALRFVITSFADGHDCAYITEAVPRSTNMINLTSHNPQGGIDIPLNSSAAGDSYSIYVDRANHGYHNSSGNIVSNYDAEGKHRLHGWSASAVVPDLSNFDVTGPTYIKAHSTKVDSVTTYDYFPFYAADFGEAKHKINYISVRTHATITGLKGFQLLCTDDETTFLASSTTGDNNGWTKVAEFTEETFAKNTTYSYSISDAPEARFWKVAVKGEDGNVMLQYEMIAMYSLSDYEVSGMYKGDSYKLNDNVRLTYKEWRNFAGSDDYNYSSGGAAALKNAYFLKLDAQDKGIEWSFDKAKTVKAVDLWTWPANAINGYELWYDDNGEWKKIKEGTFNPGNGEIGSTSTSSGSEATTITYWNSIVLDEAIETEKLKFIVTGLKSSEVGAYIAETDVRDSNNINLIAKDAASNGGNEYSIYVSHFKGSHANVAAEYAWRGWPDANGSSVNPSNGKLYHAVRFFKTRHAINRITLNVNSGKVNEFEVYCSNNDSAWTTPDSDDNWTKVATVSGSFTDSVTAEINNAAAAEYWKIKVTDFEAGTSLALAELYELGSSELSAQAINGTVSGGKVTLSLDKYNQFYEGKKTGEAKVFFALYSGNTLADTKVIDVNLNNVENEAVYTVYTVPQGISGTLKAFIWDDKLVPLTSSPTSIQ